MEASELFILIGGLLSFLMVIFHCYFYRLFQWKQEFDKIQLLNHLIFFTIHFALILFFIAFTLLSFVYLKEMASCNGLAFGLVLCYSLFWLWRTIWQVYYFKIDKSVRKKPLMHYLLIAIFGLLFISYTFPLIIHVIGHSAQLIQELESPCDFGYAQSPIDAICYLVHSSPFYLLPFTVI